MCSWTAPRDYADTAINAVETQLRDLKLDNLRMQDLATTDLISKYGTRAAGSISSKAMRMPPRNTSCRHGRPVARSDEAEHLGEIYEKRGNRDQAIDYYLLSLVPNRPSIEARVRLTALGVKDIDSRLAGARAKLAKRESVALNKADKGTAEFFLLVSPGKVEQVKFIKGDDNLKSVADILQKTDVAMKFPPHRRLMWCAVPWSVRQHSARAVHRGTGAVSGSAVARLNPGAYHLLWICGTITGHRRSRCQICVLSHR